MARKTYQLLPSRKFRMLRVKQLLESETDAQHSITMSQLLELLGEDSTSDRRTLYEDIRDLESLGTIVNIDKSKTPPHLNVVERDFSLSELKLIIDAIASSKFLTLKESQRLIDKLKMFCSRYEADSLNRQTLLGNRAKRIDENFHSYVSLVSLAIEKNVKISFKYFRINVKNKREYNKGTSVVSPWAMLYAEDNYYMMGYDETIKYYRVDRMDEVELLEEKREGEEAYQRIKAELPFRTQSTLNLFGGEKQLVTLRCRCYFYYLIQDKFGGNLLPVVEKDKEYCQVTVPVAVDTPFFGWIVSLGGKVQIKGPREVKIQMADTLNRFLWK